MIATRHTQDGIACHIQSGAGPTIFWLHGYTLNARSWRDIWALLPHFTHVAVDLPGHGESIAMAANLTLPRLAQQLGNIAVEFGAEHMVALSFGGQIALQVAAQFPQQFKSLTLGAPGLGGAPQDLEVGKIYGQLYTLYYVCGVGDAMREQWLASKIFDGSMSRLGLHQQLTDCVWQHSWGELSSSVMQTIARHEQTPALLSQIGAQTRVLVGDREMQAFRDIADELTQHLPDCQRITLDGGVHHLCMLQVPQQAATIIANQVHSTELALEGVLA